MALGKLTSRRDQGEVLYDAIPMQYVGKVMATQFKDIAGDLIEERSDRVLPRSRYDAEEE